jgi:hypothetical protein
MAASPECCANALKRFVKRGPVKTDLPNRKVTARAPRGTPAVAAKFVVSKGPEGSREIAPTNAD